MTEKQYRVKLMKTELIKPTENRSPRQKPSENFKPGRVSKPCLEDHRITGGFIILYKKAR